MRVFEQQQGRWTLPRGNLRRQPDLQIGGTLVINYAEVVDGDLHQVDCIIERLENIF